jgi:hypothetical protein
MTDPTEIKDKLIDRNINNFRQAHGTAIRIDPIAIDLCSEGNVKLEYLTEPKMPDDDDDGTNFLLRKLKDSNHLLGIDNDMTLEEFTRGFCKCREETSTSPSG